MKRFFSILLLFSTFLLSCSMENGTGGHPDTAPVIACITLDATGITQTSGILSGTASIKNAKSSGANAYFYYSTSQLDAKGLQASGQRVSASTIPSSGGDFSYILSNLTAATTYYYVASVSIDDNEEFGGVKSFTTEKKPESTSSTGDAIDITATSATLCAYANISAEVKGDIVLGVIYSTDSEPSLQNGKLLTSNDLDANNMYKVEAKDLKPQTKYYYKSMLSNGNLNYYGEVKDFTTAQVLASVSTLDAWDIEKDKAKAGGKVSISSKGDVKINACLYYGTEGTDIETLKSKGAKVTAETISDDGMFSVELSGLKAETRYNYIAVALVDDVEFVGEMKSFTTADKPAESIITGGSSDIGESFAKVYGFCSQEGSAGLSVVYGIEYSKTDLTTAASSVKATEKDSDNKFCCQLSGLSSNTLYYYRAYSLFNGIRSYGEVKSFTTKDFTVTATTNSATDITEFKATLNGKLSVTSIETLSKSVWFLYSKTASDLESLKSSGSKISCSLNDDGTSTAGLSYLSYNTTYYYVACAKVHDKTVYGEVKSFKTKDISANVTANAASNVGKVSATLNGSLSVSSIEMLSKSVYFYYSMTETTASGIKANGIKVSSDLQPDGTFSADISGISNGMNYHYIACAEVYDKEFVSDVKTFKTQTPSCPSGAVNLGLSVCWAACNVGALNQEDSGYYFAWGEITNQSYSLRGGWETYKWCKGTRTSLTKYNTDPDFGSVDNKTILDLSDDAAYCTKGNNWRTPTYEEFKELISNCTIEFTILNGVYGVKLTSKKEGYTNSSLFFPAPTEHIKGEHYTGEYWTSTLQCTGHNTTPDYAQMFSIDTLFEDCHFGAYGATEGRCVPRMIRAVAR